MTEQEQLHAQEEPLSLPRQIVDMIMSTLQNGTAKEIAERNMADRLDISEVLPNIDTTNWCEEAQDYLKEIYRIVKGTSIDTRHDLKLSFPPSDFSKTDDPVSLTYEGCYKAVGYYTAIINASPELKAAFIEAMAQHGIDADNCNEFLKREWDIWAYLLSLPEIAELTKSMPAYEDYNRSKPENRSLISAARKIEHTKSGAIVEKVSIETGGPKDENGKATPLEIASSDDMVAEITDRIMVQQCLSLLSETDREILIRHANGETYAALANAYGYKTASGMQKRIARIKKQVANRMGINVE